MKTASLFALASGLVASAMPTAYPIYSRQMAGNGPTDTQVLQYALTLEHLENAFYRDALAQFSDADFTAAGYPTWVRGRFAQIASHENDHVTLLSGALGNATVAPCTYKFPYTDVPSFISLASLIENVGVSAYAGAARYIQDPTYLTVAAVILSTEARHQSWQKSSVLQVQPWSGPYDTPLGLDMVYTIASAFITSCPNTNPALPVKAAKPLTVGANAAAGATVKFDFDNSGQGSTVEYAIFYNGLGSQVAQLDVNHMAMIPKGLQGISYVLISTSSTAAGVTTANTVAGPAILSFPFDAYVANPNFAGM